MAAIDPSQFVQEGQELSDFLCAICEKVVVPDAEPVQCSDEHLFCRDCITPLVSRGASKCPVDGAVIRSDDVTSSKRIARAVARLIVKCDFHKSGKSLRVVLGQAPGCRWRGTVNGLQEHKKNCDYRFVECPRCCESIQFRAQRLHEVYCSNVETPCTMCGKQIRARDVESHLETCEEACVPCPNMCLRSQSVHGSSSALADLTFIPRKSIEAHRADCPFEPVTCPFRPVGCVNRDDITRVDLVDHMKSSLQAHLMLLLSMLNQRQEGAPETTKSKRERAAGPETPLDPTNKKRRVDDDAAPRHVTEERTRIIQRTRDEDAVATSVQLSEAHELINRLTSDVEKSSPLSDRLRKTEDEVQSLRKVLEDDFRDRRKESDNLRSSVADTIRESVLVVTEDMERTGKNMGKFQDDFSKRVDRVDIKLSNVEAACSLLADEVAEVTSKLTTLSQQVVDVQAVLDHHGVWTRSAQSDLHRSRASIASNRTGKSEHVRENQVPVSKAEDGIVQPECSTPDLVVSKSEVIKQALEK